MNRVTKIHMTSPMHFSSMGTAPFFKVNWHTHTHTHTHKYTHTHTHTHTGSTPPHVSSLSSSVCRWLCLSGSISRASAWSSPPSAATSTTAAWTTSAPSEWRVERESHSLYACKSLRTADWLCVCVCVCVYVGVCLWDGGREIMREEVSVLAPTKACHLWGHSFLHVGCTQHKQ